MRNVSFAAVIEQVRRAHLLPFLLSVFVVTLTFPARAVRWRIMLGASTGTQPGLATVWHATAIGFMANNILPARAGELVRAYAGSQLVGLPVATSFSTIAVERIFDGIVVLLMLALGIFASPVAVPANVRTIALVMGLIFLAGLAFVAYMAHWPDRGLALADRIIQMLLPQRAADWAMRVVHHLFGGLAALRSARDFGLVLLWSFVVWGLNAASYAFAFAAFDLALPWTATVVLQGITVAGVAVPAGPGHVGTFEWGCIFALGIYGITRETALGFGLALHMAWFIPITLLGFWSLVRAGLSLGQLRGGAPAR